MTVWTFYSGLHDVYNTYVVSVPGIVNFIAQLQILITKAGKYSENIKYLINGENAIESILAAIRVCKCKQC